MEGDSLQAVLDATTLPPCTWAMDSEGFVDLNELVGSPHCALPAGFKGFTTSVRLLDSLGHEVDSDYDPLARDGCQHTDTPEWKAAHAKKAVKAVVKEVVMEEVSKPADEVVSVSTPPAAETHAVVGTPDDFFDITALLPKDGSAITGPTAALAGVVIIGGIIMKLGPGMFKAWNALRMKKLEIEEKKAEKEQEGHAKCEADRLALHAQIGQLESAVASLKAAIDAQKPDADGFSFGNINFSDVVDRVEDIEAVIKTLDKVKKASSRSKKKEE